MSLDSLYLKEQTVQLAKYQYDGIFVAAERDGAGSLRSGYSRTPDGRLLSWFKPQQRNVGDQSGAFLVDHLGSVVKMTRASDGSMVNQYTYDDFGRVTMSTEVVPNDLKFTGAVLDTSNLYHLSARFYSPNTGRFITQDSWKGSVWEPWSQNLYVYVGNNPVNYVDPTGHFRAFRLLDGGGGGGLAPLLAMSANWLALNGQDVAQTAVDVVDCAGDPSVAGCAPLIPDAVALVAPGTQTTPRANSPKQSSPGGPHPSPEGGRIIVDPYGNAMIEPAGGATVGKGDGTFSETRYPNESPAQQFHQGHNPGEPPHGHGFLEGPGRNQRGQSLSPDGRPVDYRSRDAHWPVYTAY